MALLVITPAANLYLMEINTAAVYKLTVFAARMLDVTLAAHKAAHVVRNKNVVCLVLCVVLMEAAVKQVKSVADGSVVTRLLLSVVEQLDHVHVVRVTVVPMGDAVAFLGAFVVQISAALAILSAAIQSTCKDVVWEAAQCAVITESVVQQELVAVASTNAVCLTYLMTSLCLSGLTRP